MIRTLREVLRANQATYVERENAAHALSFPSCWPVDPELAAIARGFCAPPTEPPAPGETILLTSTKSEGGMGGLWWMGRERSTRGRIPFTAAAAALGRSVVKEARKVLPFAIFSEGEVTLETLGAQCVAAEHVAPQLDGASFGLTFALAAASHFLGVALPCSVAATARIGDAPGALADVEGLDAKLRVLAGTGLGVTRVLVHSGQAGDARRLLDDAGATYVAVVPVSTVAEAVRQTFLPSGIDIELWLGQPEEHASRIDLIFRYALCGLSGTRGAANGPDFWRHIEQLAEHLGREESDPLLRTRLDVAARIARRHIGRANVEDRPLELPPLDEALELCLFPEPRSRQRFADRYRAHGLQAAADSSSPLVDLWLAESELHVGERPGVAGLALLGACGRARAALREYARAVDDLNRAFEGWLDIEKPEESTHALCELLRVSGVLGRREEVKALRDRIISVLDAPSVDDVARAFVRLAWGRALVQCGCPAAAVAELDDRHSALWTAADPHCALSRQRTLARALRALGRHDEAEELRARAILESAKLTDPTAELLRQLLALDCAIAVGEGDIARRLIAVLPAEAQALGGLLARIGPGDDPVRVIADEYPY